MRFGARPDASFLAAALLTGPGLALLSLLTDPDPRGFGTHEQLGLPACGVLLWSGVPCPACGVTTAVVLATRGRFLESLAVQPFGFLLSTLLLSFFVAGLYCWRNGRDLRALVLVRPRWQMAGVTLAACFAWIWKVFQVAG